MIYLGRRRLTEFQKWFGSQATDRGVLEVVYRCAMRSTHVVPRGTGHRVARSTRLWIVDTVIQVYT